MNKRESDKIIHKYIPFKKEHKKTVVAIPTFVFIVIGFLFSINWLPWETANAAEDKYKLMLKMKTQDSEWYTKLEVRLAKIETSLTSINSNVERLLDRRER